MHLANLYANVAFPIPLIPLKMYALDNFLFFKIPKKYCSILLKPKNSSLNLGVCADWFVGPRLEAGWISANDLYKKIVK